MTAPAIDLGEISLAKSEHDHLAESANTPMAPWITFSGSADDSPSGFVRSVQRIGFQQGKARDDEWMADYASTCFQGDALYWYCGLPGDIQGSWKELRSSFLKQYLPVVKGPGRNSNEDPTKPLRTQMLPEALSIPVLPSPAPVVRGIIEVVGHDTDPLGCLSFNGSSGAFVCTDEEEALVVTISQDSHFPTLQINMRTSLATIDSNFPYLGLGLVTWDSQSPNIVPGDLYVDSRTPAPVLSPKCKASADVKNPTGDKIATWTLSACGESRTPALYRRKSDTQTPGQRGAAAVWKYDPTSQELTLQWLMDNDNECSLQAYVHRGSSDNLHVHRSSDVSKVAKYILEDLVRFVFRPVLYSCLSQKRVEFIK